MTFKNPSGVHQLSASAPGVGAVTLVAGPASAGRVTFDAAVGTANTCFYGIEAMSGSDGAEWGVGTVTTTAGVTTLTRDTVIENTSGTTSKINFTSLVHVWVDVPGIRDVFINSAGDAVDLPEDVALEFSGNGASRTRDNLGLEIGVDVQAYSAILAGITSVPPRPNILINGDGRIDQMNNGNATNTNDDSYGSSDLWYSLTQTSYIAVQRGANGANGIPFYQRLTQSQASAQRMGRAQIVQSADARKYRGGPLTLSGKVRCSAAQAIRYAILEWTGTADIVTSDVVNSWTNATFTAGQFFNATDMAVVAVGAITPAANTWTDLAALTGNVSANCNNLFAFIWTEGTAAQNVTLDFTAKLEAGSDATPDLPRATSDERVRCEYFYRRLGGSAFAYFCQGLANTTTTVEGFLGFGTMRAAPTMGVSAAGDFQVLRAGPAADTATVISITNTYTNGCRIAITIGAANLTAAAAVILRLGSGGTGYIEMDARL